MKKTEELRKGDVVRLFSFGNTSVNYRHLLLSLGITRGTQILVKSIAPLGCPIQIEVLGVSLGLRIDEAKELLWE